MRPAASGAFQDGSWSSPFAKGGEVREADRTAGSCRHRGFQLAVTKIKGRDGGGLGRGRAGPCLTVHGDREPAQLRLPEHTGFDQALTALPGMARSAWVIASTCSRSAWIGASVMPTEHTRLLRTSATFQRNC